MEKFILKTIIYADIFNFPLKGWEIHKWLIGKQTSLTQVQTAINRLIKKEQLKESKGYIFLPGRVGLISRRIKNDQQSTSLLRKAKIVSLIFKIIPWIKLVGVSGALAMKNAGKSDDIDLFIVTTQNRMWLSRLLMLGILQILGLRRRPGVARKHASGKICLNLILESCVLEQSKKNLYTAHEVLQMKVLWQRDDMYARFLEANAWAFEFLPNWVGSEYKVVSSKYQGKNNQNNIINTIDSLAKRFQLKIMKTPKGDERIEEHALYFHPQDHSKRVLPLDRSVSV